jgi:hypothetical protein
MTVKEMMAVLPLKAVTNSKPDLVIQGGYVSDLLSNVMANAQQGDVWVTMQAHQNIIAVASLLGLSAIIVAGGIEPDDDAINKAHKEGINLLIAKANSFEVVGLLYEQGVRSAC